MEKGSFTEKLIDKEDEENLELVNLLSNQINADKNYSVDSDFFEEALGIGKFTQLILEELTDEQDNFEAFFTIMFLIGCIFIPFVLIFSEYIKPYDLSLISTIQNSDVYSQELFLSIGNYIKYFFSLNFHISLTVFIYLAIDPGVGYKVTMVAGTCTYFSYFLQVIIHDSRPYWHSSLIKPVFCHVTFGCPSVNVLGGLIYYNLLNFYINRAIKSKDPFIEKNLTALYIGSFIAKFFIIINIMLGILLIANGEHFIYQIILTFLIGFIIVRIVIAFNKEIDYYTNGARYMQSISNYTTIWVFILVFTFSVLSWIFYYSIYQDLLISQDYITNINVIYLLRQIAHQILMEF